VGGKELAGELKILENGRGRDEQDARELGFFNVQGTFTSHFTGRGVLNWPACGRFARAGEPDQLRTRDAAHLDKCRKCSAMS